MISKKKCPGCLALFDDVDYPVHAYGGMSSGCWQLATEIFAREYSDPAYMQVHRLTVDAYMTQHHLANTEPRIVQSLNLHLLALYLTLEKKVSYDLARETIGQVAQKYKYQFKWLKPPASRGNITIIDVHKAQSAKEHCALVKAWADSTWQAWQPHHDYIAHLAQKA